MDGESKMDYYRSIRLINGKLKKVIVDEFGDIIECPTKDQIDMSIDDPKRYKPKACSECGSRYKLHKNEYINEKGYWTKRFFCHIHYTKRYNDEHRKILSNARTGNLDRYSSFGKEIIGQWIIGKTLGLKDLNLENDNFHERIDLSRHHLYLDIDVKTASYNRINMQWRINRVNINKFDTLMAVCMDMHELWKDVKKIFIIPFEVIGGIKSITFIISPSLGFSKWEKFRVDEKPYNDTYHGVEIPRFFNPWKLWNGRYNKYME